MRNALGVDWLSRDGKLLIAASSVRAFGLGFLSVTLAVYLAELGLTLVQIGAFFTVGAAGVSFFAVVVALSSEKLGRKRLLVSLTLASTVAFVSLILTDNVVVLAVFAFLGAVSVGQGGAAGATQPLIQASLAETAADARRTDTFVLYRITNTFSRAFGALAAGLPVVLGSAFGLDEVGSFKVVLAGLTASLVVVALLYAALTPAHAATQRGGWTNPLRLPNRRTIFILSGLFSMDAFGGSLLIQSLVAYWFYTKFGFELGQLALVFFASELLTAVSMWVAGKLANRIGLLNTMVFTHIPASLFLLGAAFAPVGWVAVVFWQLRAFFSQMDVPTRDSYIMAVVTPEERVAMASMQQLGRSAANTAGPSIATAMWTGVSASAPFVACSVIKIAYDLSLWWMFKDVRPPEEAARREAGTATPAGNR